MNTAIRMDDVTADMDYSKFNRVKKILDEAGIRPLIGVVPFCKDETLRIEDKHDDFPRMISELQKQGWVIALHGYNHLYTTRNQGIFPINNFSEFAGVEYGKQREMIRKGIARLHEWGVEPKLFMAPGHTFDKNTLKALKDNGITAVTDGFGEKPYIREGIKFYPISKRRKECTSEKYGFTTYVLHTNTMSDKEMDKFEKMIKEKRKQILSYDEFMEIEAVKRGWFGNAKEYCQAMAKHILVSRRASEGTVIHSSMGE